MPQKKDTIQRIKSQFTPKTNDILELATKDWNSLKSTIHIFLYRYKSVKLAFNKVGFHAFYNKSLQFISLS